MKLEEMIPNAEIRKTIYQVFGLVGLVLGAIQVGFSAAPDTVVPAWIGIALTVYAFLGTAGFATAQANTLAPTAKVVGIPTNKPVQSQLTTFDPPDPSGHELGTGTIDQTGSAPRHAA